MKIIYIIGIMLGAVIVYACAKNSSSTNNEEATKVKLSKRLTTDVLNQADTITYYHDNGTVAPPYQFQCYIIVTPKNVTVKVEGSYGEKKLYNKTEPLTETQYNSFIEELASQNIRKTKNNGRELECGGSTSYIVVKAKGETIFNGNERINLKIENGNLAHSFLYILTPELLDAAKNPIQFIKGEE